MPPEARMRMRNIGRYEWKPEDCWFAWNHNINRLLLLKKFKWVYSTLNSQTLLK
jgi:hypothetical protein